MDIKNDQVFDEFNTNEPTVYATNAEICEKAQMELPLPKEDFDKNKLGEIQLLVIFIFTSFFLSKTRKNFFFANLAKNFYFLFSINIQK